MESLDNLKDRIQTVKQAEEEEKQKIRNQLIEAINKSVDDKTLVVDLATIFGTSLTEKDPIAADVRKYLKGKDIYVIESFQPKDRYRPCVWTWKLDDKSEEIANVVEEEESESGFCITQ